MCDKVYTFTETNIKGRAKKIQYIINEKGCWECISHVLNNGGYPTIHRNNKFYKLSRYIYELTKGELIDGHVIMHTCDNPKCINPNHLVQGTQKENIEDMYNKNRGSDRKGSKVNTAKISERIAYEIKFLANAGIFTVDEICEIYSISKDIYINIKAEKTWKHIECDYKGLDYSDIHKGKLNYKQIVEIKKLIKHSKLSNYKIAEMFKVNNTTIRAIRLGITYDWVRLDE